MKRFRAVLPLLKARVSDRGPHHFSLTFGPEYGSPTTIRVSCNMEAYDIRDGDLLTIYTEVLIKGAQDA